jgi:hypothetical protein
MNLGFPAEHTALGSVARWDLRALAQALKKSGMPLNEGD